MKKIKIAAVLLLALSLAACSSNESVPSANEKETDMATNSSQPSSNGNETTVRDFIDALSNNDIAAAKKVAEQYLKDSPNGVISVTFDTEMRRSEMWNNYGDGLGGDPNQRKFSPGNLAVFNVDTKRYGDQDFITLGRKNANSEWEVLDYGR